MKTNMGTADRIIRLVVAAILVALYFMDILTGTAGIVGLVIAVVFAATALVKFCGLYALLGVNTCSRE